MTRLSREHSLLHTIKYGKSRMDKPAKIVNADLTEKLNEFNDKPIELEAGLDQQPNNEYNNLNECNFNKEVYFEYEHGIDNKQTLDYRSTKKKNKYELKYPIKRIRRIMTLTFIFLLGFLGLYKCGGSVISSQLTGKVSRPIFQVKHAWDTASFLDNGIQDTREIFQVTYPKVIKSSYGESVYHQTLINHYFGQSWGSPAVVSFTPPSIEFNKVVLTLNTNSSGVQYDRLAHFFINGIQVWRTSTMEPGGRQVHSFFQKDISEYSSLFKQNATLTFELDNIISGRLNGGFQVNLDVDFYYEPEESDILSTHSLPKVYAVGPITMGSPIQYLPADKYTFKLPKLNSNTTRLKLSIFTSGNGDEEFWYTNVLNSNTNKYSKSGVSLLGHGPVRIVTVLYNGEPIANVVPEPVIFTGGFAPPLWSPIVSVSAFDLRSIDLDITGILANLSEDDIFEISITNGIDDHQIGSNWLTNANIQVWENNQVVGSSGTLTHTSNVKNRVINLSFVDINQVISYTATANISSNLTYKLANGSSIDSTINLGTSASISNVQVYSNQGFKQVITAIGNNEKDFVFGDLSEVIKTSYPVILTMDSISNGSDTSYDFVMVNSKQMTIDKNGATVFELNDVQNGTSTFTISPNGNHGTGNTEVKYSLKGRNVDYYRQVEAEAGSVVYDFESYD